MNPIRFTLTAGSIAVHDGLYQREPSPAEANLIREALEPKRLPLWLDALALAAITAMVAIMVRGGGA